MEELLDTRIEDTDNKIVGILYGKGCQVASAELTEEEIRKMDEKWREEIHKQRMLRKRWLLW